MFARVFNTARKILSRSPSVPDPSSESKEATPSSGNTTPRRSNTPRKTPRKMVTSTRRGPVVDRTPVNSARKSKRTMENVDDAPISTKKRRKSPVSVQVETEEAVSSKPTPKKEGKLAIRRRGGSPKVVVPMPSSPAMVTSASPVKSTQDEVAPSVEETITSAESSETVTDQTPAKKRKGKKAKSPEVVVEAKKEAKPATNTRIRFGSEEPAKTPAADVALEKKPAPQVVEEDDSDSDEAPEEVTASSALTKAKAAEAEATRAFEAQQKKEELKKKERAEHMAKEQKDKRERETKKAKKLAKIEAREQANQEAEPGFKMDIRNLPALLPDSFLEAAGDRRPATPPRSLPGTSYTDKKKEELSRHIKFLEQGEQRIKDVLKGSVTVRVLEEQNKHLAAKVNKGTKNVREKWLNGRQAQKKKGHGRGKMEHKKVERRTFGGGFLRGDD